MNKEEFIVEVEKLGINLNQDMLDKLDKYYKLLVEWNEKINLTAITEENEVYLKHFYDSLTLARDYDFNKPISLCDVGTGAGFPGIVLKIVFPNLKITLLDSLNKRIVFLNEIIDKLELKDIETVHARMEDYSIKNNEKFDIITARAVASLSFLSEISIRSLKVNGLFMFMKGNQGEELEIDNLLKELSLYKEKIDYFKLPIENSNRSIIVLKKIDKTNNKYPRNITKIKSFPL